MHERTHATDPQSAALIDALRDHLPRILAKHQTPGLNIALADGGRLIWEAGFGLADVVSARPMTPDTTYHSGSLGKVYTATAVMILVDRGIIALDDPVNRHLPFEVRNPLGSREITVHDLMVHKSGLGVDGAACSWTPGTSLADDVAAEYAREMAPYCVGLMPRWTSQVGTAWCYSNLGLATLGLLVETANPEGLGFPDFVQRHIMDPLGMTLSQYPHAQCEARVKPEIWSLASTGYARMGGADIPTLPVYFREYPAGGTMQRPADHLRLLLAMMNGGELEGYRLFSPEIARQMLSPATELARTDGERALMGSFDGEQGLMWRLNQLGRPWTSFDHGGGHMFGWRNQGRAWPNYGAAVMVASNQWSMPEDSGDVQEIVEFVEDWLRYRPAIAAPQAAAIGAAELSYVRGAMQAALYQAMTGIAGAPPAAAFDAMLAGVRDRDGDWDAQAFRRGFDGMAAAAQSIASARAWWSSPACEVDVSTVKTAHAMLGGRTPGMFSLLLPE